MTSTIDPATAEAPELCRLLAEKPCPTGWRTKDRIHPAACICDGTGLAFPLASEPCPKIETVFHPDTCGCNSGRVPKALGLEELLEHTPNRAFLDILAAIDNENIRAINEGTKPDYTLAALRAVAKALMREDA